MVYTGENPNASSEVISFTFPEFSKEGWKELSKTSSKNYGLIEVFPVSESSISWTQLIYIQYFRIYSKPSLKNLLGHLRSETVASYPGNRVSWNIIEEKKESVLYEWILHKAYQNIPPQYEISRLFSGKKGFYRVGITKRYGSEMSLQEKEFWRQALETGVSIIPEGATLENGIFLPGY
ncbi:MAG: hypothetical protein QRY74_02490 [Chlamydia sp.]